MINIKWVDSEQDIPQDLWQSCFPPPLEGQWWYSVLERSRLQDQFKFIYGILLRNECPIGIIPAFLMDVPVELVAPDTVAPVFRFLSNFVPSCGYQRTLFVGSPCADEGSIGLMPGISLQDIVEPIQAELLKLARGLKVSMLAWKDFPEHAQNALDKLCLNGKAFKMESYPGTIVNLKEPSMKSYLASLKSSRRHNLLKKLKRSKEALALNVSVVQNPDQSVLDDIFALFWQTYEKSETKFERLNKEFFSLIAQQKEAWFILLRQPENNQLVAYMLCFYIGDRVINKFIGLDYQIARDTFLYFRLWEAALEWMISLGVKEIQSGQTGYRFKLDVGNELVPLANYCQHTNPLVNFIYGKIASTVSWATLDNDLRTFLKAHPEALPSRSLL